MADWPSDPKPSKESQLDWKDDMISAEFDGGYMHSRPRWPRRLRVWRLIYPFLTKAQLDTFMNTYDTYRGSTFTLDDPIYEIGTYKVWAPAPPKIRTIVPSEYYSMEIVLEERF